MKATGKHRDRKNGASREQWQKRKQAANAARGTQYRINGGWIHATRNPFSQGTSDAA